MSKIPFYLLGESPATSQEIEIPMHTDLEDLQHLIASHLAIVEIQGNQATLRTLLPIDGV